MTPEELIPAVGKWKEFEVAGHTFRVTRPRKNVCCLARVNPKGERARFGTVPQIRRDIAYTIENENLPPRGTP